MADYFRRRAGPRPRLGAGGAHGCALLPPRQAGHGPRARAPARTDPVLFAWSHDFVGDLAETAALLWPGPEAAAPRPGRASPRWSRALDDARRKDELPGLVAGWLDRLDATGRWALLKLVTGELRVGASARLAKLALAGLGGVEPERGRGGLARAGAALPRPVRLAGGEGAPPRGRGAGPGVPAADAGAPAGGRRTCRARPRGAARSSGSGTGSGSRSRPRRAGCGSSRAPATTSRRRFPEIVEAVRLQAVLDGELLVGGPGGPAR